ncbi:hypothetical protein N1851_015330 [Merluccius polli]|uniref:Uncharacterized protein n=1 Tax=Merluccius polli TaxID=89951 RepID=A0AA47P0F6_MERPO|nr:hypothetical protein N1851_015330 [Merluccius polli]
MAPLSATEKQRRYRARRDVDHERRQQYLNKEERWRKDIDEGRKKKVSDLSEREKRAVRKKWRERKRKRKNDRARTTFQSMTTPPSPDTPPEPENAPEPGPSRVNNTIRKRLLLQESIIEDIRNKYRNTKKEREKQFIARATTGKIIKKYRLQRAAQATLGFSKKRCHRPDARLMTYERKKSNTLPAECKQKVKAFFLRDDASQMTTGRKQTVTQKKKKKQTPFWVVVPTEADHLRHFDVTMARDSLGTASILWPLQFMANTLYSQGLSATKNLEEMVDATMCDPKSKLCAYGECKDCVYSTHTMLRAPENTEIALTQWSLEDNAKVNDGDESGKRSTITVKKNVMTTEDELASDIFNIRWQYGAYRQLRENLRNNECLLHVDFSENYSCKYSQEIQSVHFGGSHQQATLHTGVLYTAAEQSPVTFCSISPSRRHDPPAIWAHLDPVLDMVRERYPLINRLHVFSDGPATQYKQKGNFYLISKEPFKKGFKDIS